MWGRDGYHLLDCLRNEANPIRISFLYLILFDDQVFQNASYSPYYMLTDLIANCLTIGFISIFPVVQIKADWSRSTRINKFRRSKTSLKRLELDHKKFLKAFLFQAFLFHWGWHSVLLSTTIYSTDDGYIPLRIGGLLCYNWLEKCFYFWILAMSMSTRGSVQM